MPPISTRQFASDNYSGICPEAFRALENANPGHARAYGEDEHTLRACNLIREFFETECEVFFTYNGTAANSLALAALCKSYHGVICHELAHLETDECGAPEFFSGGTKVLVANGADGKIDPAAVEHAITRRSDVHYPRVRAISVTQATEVGTVYTVAELRQVADVVRRHRLSLHMDGARFANAVVSLGVQPREISWEAGVDVLCLGGTKVGLPVGDAVVFFNRELAREFDLRCKQAGQLASKMRFLSAPWSGVLEDGAFLRHAAHANQMAERLCQELSSVPSVKVMFARQANSVFVELSPSAADALADLGWRFYRFIGQGGCRLMCSWDTTEDDVAALVDDVRKVASTIEIEPSNRHRRDGRALRQP